MKILAVIGDPISHSLSPIMHNAALIDKKLQNFYHYSSYHVTPNSLKKFIDDLDNNNISGFNVTLPHKIAIIPHLDKIDEDTREIGAINTVVKKNSTLIGYNTDKDGFLLSLKENNIEYKNKKTLILGAGGAATAIVYGLLKNGSEIKIYNRTESKSLILKEKFDNLGSIEIQKTLNTENVDLIVNTTSVGMNSSEIPVNPKYINSKHTVIDIIYTPFETSLLQEAKQKNCFFLGGLDMLINQGALAFTLFTNVNPDRTVMKNAVLNYLNKKKNRIT